MLIERELELYGQSTDGSDLAGAEVLVPNDGDATCIDSRLQVGLPAQAQSLDGIGVGDSRHSSVAHGNCDGSSTLGHSWLGMPS